MFLIVDDSFVDRLIARKILELNYNQPDVVETNSAKDGIDWLQNHSHAIKEKIYILLDIRMPEMSGFDFLDIYSSLPEDIKENVSIIMLSSTLDHTDIEMAASHQYVKRLLEKPLDPSQLKKVVN